MMTPKETIAHYNKIYIWDFLESKGFLFNEEKLEYVRKTKDFKQVIWHRCDRNNQSGVRIKFEQGYCNLSNKFKSWYNKTYASNPTGGDVVIGAENNFIDNWNMKYQKYIGTLSYDLIKKDIEDQFDILLKNITNVMLPYLDKYKDFDSVINNPNKITKWGQFDMLAHIRCIEYAIFNNKMDRAISLAEKLKLMESIDDECKKFRDVELERIFN